MSVVCLALVLVFRLISTWNGLRFRHVSHDSADDYFTNKQGW